VAVAELAEAERRTSDPPLAGDPEHVSLIALLWRQRRITLPILALTVVASVVAQVTAPPHYRAVGSVVLATSSQDPSRLPESIAQVSDAMAEMQRAEVRDTFLVEDADFSASMLDRTTLVVGASARRADAAEETVTAAVTWLRTAIEERQDLADIPPGDRLEGRLLTPTVVARRTAAGTYAAEAVVWVDGLSGAQQNPYQASPVTTRLLSLSLASTEGRETIATRIGPNITYIVAHDPWGPLPTLDIVTEGPDRRQVIEAFAAITTVLQLELEGRQSRAQVPLAQRIFVDVLAQPATAEDTSPAVSPLAVVVAMLGLALAGGAAAVRERRANDAPASPSRGPA
jgi:hypothetical protein